MKSRIVVVFTLLLACWAVLLSRAVMLQVLQNGKLERLRERQFSKKITIPGRRGAIYDRNGKELALTMTTYSLFADPKLITQPKTVTRQLVKTLKLPFNSTYRELKDEKKRFVWLKRNLSKEQRDQISAWDVRGLGFIEEAKRVYPNGTLASQVLGSVGRGGAGLEGVEKQYNSLLQGEHKKISVLRDARGRPLIVTGDWFEDDLDGQDIVLTIDRDLQFFIERELQEVVAKNKAESAVAVVLDADSSEVLAMANYPSYDPEDRREKGWSKWSKNRTVTDAFEPGSTLKTMLVAAALGKGVVTPNKKYFCENGRFKIGRRTIRDDIHSYGWLTVDEILSKSSNIGVSKIAFELGDRLYGEALQSMGFGERTGIDFPGESRGIMHELPWRQHLLANISFGHGLTATPVQMASAYAAIARGGIWKAPRLLRSVKKKAGRSADFAGVESADGHRVMSPEIAKQVTMMLTSVTGENGTGTNARVPGFLVAGKTGTAQKVDPNGRGYLRGAYISSFAGFVPAHSPKFVIYIAVDNPQNAYYGSAVAAPVFSRIASFGIRKSGLEPVLIDSKNLLVKDDLDHRVRKALLKLQRTASSDSDSNRIPEMKGWTLREVYRRMKSTEVELKIEGRGVVAKTIPPAGEKIDKEKRLKIIFSEVQ